MMGGKIKEPRNRRCSAGELLHAVVFVVRGAVVEVALELRAHGDLDHREDAVEDGAAELGEDRRDHRRERRRELEVRLALQIAKKGCGFRTPMDASFLSHKKRNTGQRACAPPHRQVAEAEELPVPAPDHLGLAAGRNATVHRPGDLEEDVYRHLLENLLRHKRRDERAHRVEMLSAKSGSKPAASSKQSLGFARLPPKLARGLTGRRSASSTTRDERTRRPRSGR